MRLTTFAAAVTVVILSAADASFTLDILRKGGSELNPAMDYLLRQSVTLFVTFKIALTIGCVMILAAFGELPFLRWQVRHVLFAAVLAYILLMVWHGICITLSN